LNFVFKKITLKKITHTHLPGLALFVKTPKKNFQNRLAEINLICYGKGITDETKIPYK